ncbi:hypothetical protein AB0442_38975 [Kitasatospora sp. NPDC085895]|uniref:hypothetical protein n=1 Tax=Kitasatospora sp. NPDC085895 TaxID=3155057 RepID=UPI003450A170
MLFEGVCELLTGSGLLIAAPGRPGLHVGHGPRGVVVDWQESGTAMSGAFPLTVPPQPAGPPTGSSLARFGEREAVVFALAAVLEHAGFPVTAQAGGTLLITAGTGTGDG